MRTHLVPQVVVESLSTVMLCVMTRKMQKGSSHDRNSLHQILTSTFYSAKNGSEFKHEQKPVSYAISEISDSEDDRVIPAPFLELTSPNPAPLSSSAGILDLDPQFRLRSEGREARYQNLLTQPDLELDEQLDLLAKDLLEVSERTKKFYLTSSLEQKLPRPGDNRSEQAELNGKTISEKIKSTVANMTKNLQLSSKSTKGGLDEIETESERSFERNDNQVWRSVVLGSHLIQEVSWPRPMQNCGLSYLEHVSDREQATPYKILKPVPSHDGSFHERLYIDRVLKESLDLRTPSEPMPLFRDRILEESIALRTPLEPLLQSLYPQPITPTMMVKLHVPRIRVMNRDGEQQAPTAKVPGKTEMTLDFRNDRTIAEVARMSATEQGLEHEGRISPPGPPQDLKIEGKGSRPSARKSRFSSLAPIIVQIPEIDGHPARIEKYDSKPGAIAALYHQGSGVLSNFCTYDATNRIIRTYNYGSEHPDEEDLRQNGLETMWLPITLDHDELTDQRVSNTTSCRNELSSAHNSDCLIGRSRDISMEDSVQSPLTHHSLNELNLEDCSSRRDSRYDAETDFLDNAVTLSKSKLGADLLSRALATIAKSGPENDCYGRISTRLKSSKSTPSSDHGRAILDDDDFFIEVDPDLARSYLGSQYSQSPRTSLLDIERILEEDAMLDPEVRRELQDTYDTLALEWAAPTRTWIDLGRSYLSIDSQTGLAQSALGESTESHHLSIRKTSFPCCSSSLPCVEHLENGEFDPQVPLDNCFGQSEQSSSQLDIIDTETTGNSMGLTSHRRCSSSDMPTFEHIEDVALEAPMSVDGSFDQDVAQLISVADAMPTESTVTLVQIVSRTSPQPTSLHYIEKTLGSEVADIESTERSWSSFEGISDIPKARQGGAVARAICHLESPVAEVGSLVTTPSLPSNGHSRRTNRRSRVYHNITRDKEWPAYATVRRSPRRPAFQTNLRKASAEPTDSAENEDEKRSLSVGPLPSGFHFSKIGDHLVERENVVDIFRDHLTEITAKCKEAAELFQKSATELVANEDNVSTAIADTEPVEIILESDLLLKPVTAEDLNLKIVGKAARNSQLARQEKSKKVGALIDVFQSHGLMPQMMGPKFYGISSPSFAHQSSGRPASVSPRVVSRSGTEYGIAGTGCVATVRQNSPIQDIYTPLSYPLRPGSAFSHADTELSSMFGEPLEEVDMHEDGDKSKEYGPSVQASFESSTKMSHVEWIVGDENDDNCHLSLSVKQLEEPDKHKNEETDQDVQVGFTPSPKEGRARWNRDEVRHGDTLQSSFKDLRQYPPETRSLFYMAPELGRSSSLPPRRRG